MTTHLTLRKTRRQHDYPSTLHYRDDYTYDTSSKGMFQGDKMTKQERAEYFDQEAEKLEKAGLFTAAKVYRERAAELRKQIHNIEVVEAR